MRHLIAIAALLLAAPALAHPPCDPPKKKVAAVAKPARSLAPARVVKPDTVYVERVIERTLDPVARFESLLEDECLARLVALVELGIVHQYTGPDDDVEGGRTLMVKDIEHALTLLAERGEPS